MGRPLRLLLDPGCVLMTRKHGTMGSRYPVEVTDEHGRTTIAALLPPEQPTLRRSPDLSAYDRLDPPRPVRPTRYGRSRVEDLEGMARLREALDGLGAKVKAAHDDALQRVAEETLRRARMRPVDYW